MMLQDNTQYTCESVRQGEQDVPTLKHLTVNSNETGC